MPPTKPSSVKASAAAPGASGHPQTASDVPGLLMQRIHQVMREESPPGAPWMGFDRFMALALYEPGLGYYAHSSRKFGLMPQSGSDFVTAPELTPLFGRTLARQVRQALDAVVAAGGSRTVWEFGAGTGALAEQVLDALGDEITDWVIVDLSGALRERQAQRLARFGARVRWADTLAPVMDGVVLGNEVLDAMPVQLIAGDGQRWLERGVTLDAQGALAFADRPTALQPPPDVQAQFLPVPGAVTELPTHAQAFIRTLAGHLRHAVALFIDYGFPEAEYYHPQRLQGTLMCHQAHRADADPLSDVGLKDITAHVDFTAMAVTAQDVGLDVLGYTSQARFLMNCGLLELLRGADPRDVALAQKLLAEHEMGELFKVLALGRGVALTDPLGFASGDRTHRL